MKTALLAVIAVFAICCMAVYAGDSSRPKGTCRGYTDKNSNGFCDLSENDKCKSKKCPASTYNSKNAEALKKWKEDGKALEFSKSDEESNLSLAENKQKETPKTKTPCPGNCANCPLAGACI